MSGIESNPPLPPTEPMSQIKEQIASRTYRVDSRAVAREMLFKMRMMALIQNLQRHQPVSGAEAPSPTDPAQRRSWSNPDASRTDPSA